MATYALRGVDHDLIAQAKQRAREAGTTLDAVLRAYLFASAEGHDSPAAQLGKLGGQARAANLSEEERRDSARQAVQALAEAAAVLENLCAFLSSAPYIKPLSARVIRVWSTSPTANSRCSTRCWCPKSSWLIRLSQGLLQATGVRAGPTLYQASTKSNGLAVCRSRAVESRWTTNQRRERTDVNTIRHGSISR